MAEKTTKKRTTKATRTSSKPAVKSSPKKVERSTRARSTAQEVTKVEESKKAPQEKKAFRMRKSYMLTLLGILGLVGLLYLFRNVFVAATVNGQPISRLSVIQELERQGGKQTIDSLVTKSVINQEAKKRNITISQSEIDGELKKIDQNLQSQGQKLDQVLELQGMTKEQLVEQIRLQKLIEKMIGTIAISDEEITEYLTNNAESLPQDQDEATLRANVKERLQQQKLNEQAQTFLEKLRNEAKINYFINY